MDRMLSTLTRISRLDDSRVASVVLPDGEQFKTMDVLMKVFETALSCRLGRKATIIALGGGVIGDMAGFAAAVYQRGCNFIQVPTTLMAMVDSSVGGKTGVNHPLGKNMIGAFYQPQCVVIDTDTLNTLPQRELASGIAEVVKYGLIRDAEFFEWQEQNMDRLVKRDTEALSYAIERSCLNKAAVVAADELESSAGVRATLNLGHTFGHAIENGCGYGKYLHGEAVAMGIVMAADMSKRLQWIDEGLLLRITDILQAAGLSTEPPRLPDLDIERYLDLMAVDKKNVDGNLRLILLKGALGSCVFTPEFDHDKLMATLKAFTN